MRWTEIALASGGLAFFPENVDDVHAICEQVAHDIRHQYTLAYYPSNRGEGRDVSNRACGSDSAARAWEAGGADEKRVLRAYGEQRGFGEVTQEVSSRRFMPGPACRHAEQLKPSGSP